MYIDAMVHDFPKHARLEALCDLSQKRMDWQNMRLRELFGAAPIKTYRAEQFDQMIREVTPDWVIVTSMDSTHDKYIVRAMELGCDVISEKPMTTDHAKARAIFDAIERTGRKLRVTFNYRYSPFATRVRELMTQGVVGTPMLVHFSWMLNTAHGADYFRRWHGEKKQSSGLQLHKSSHHFDIVNWWIDSYPKTVFAMGGLKFYGNKAAAGRGEKYSYSRYTGVAAAKNDPFALFLDKREENERLSVPGLRGLYLDAEAETGYIRDRNVFGDHVTIEDTLGAVVRYRNDVVMTYSLVAYSPWEGFRMEITGDKGRIEICARHGSHIIAGQTAEQLAAEQAQGASESVKVFPMFGVPYEVAIPDTSGAHGGGDELLLREIFTPPSFDDPFKRAASHIDGAASCLIGFSINESMRTGLPVQCDDLLQLPDKCAGALT
jgi:predicted dehydrogenase